MLKVTEQPFKNGIKFYDFTGELRQSGEKSHSALEIYLVSAHIGKTLVGSLVYEVFDKSIVKDLREWNDSGPYFRKTGPQILFLQTVYVKKNYRNNGIMLAMLDKMLDKNLPIYSCFTNLKLKHWFDETLGVI